MRLGQLARQLSISPEKIVAFLSSREIAMDGHHNARIDDRYVDLVLQEFAPGNDSLRQQVIQTTDIDENREAPATGEPTLFESPAEPPELIKAPKVELPGLRVLGKIELPEKKKPEPPQESAEDPAHENSRPTFVSRNPRRREQPRDGKNPIALAREREERERQRKIDEERAKEKERKAAYYQKRLKPQPPTKAVRLIEEEVEEMAPLAPERPKTLWGRFMRWLND